MCTVFSMDSVSSSFGVVVWCRVISPYYIELVRSLMLLLPVCMEYVFHVNISTGSVGLVSVWSGVMRGMCVLHIYSIMYHIDTRSSVVFY